MENNYELTLVIDAERYQDVVANIEKLLKLNKAEVESKDEWGVRALAYPINKHSNANYIIFNIKVNPAVVNKLQQQLNIEEGVLRYLLIVPDQSVIEDGQDDKEDEA